MQLPMDGHDTRWYGGKRRRDGDADDAPCHQIMKGVEGSASKWRTRLTRTGLPIWPRPATAVPMAATPLSAGDGEVHNGDRG